MRFHNHYHELPAKKIDSITKKYTNQEHQTAVWNAFVDSELSGINEDDCAIIPRILPLSYLATIKRTAYLLTKFALSLLSLPENEIRAIIPHGPIRDFLIEELQVLKYRKSRLTGSFRFDMAIVGPARPNNPPKLLELNEIGFDGLARSSFIQQTLLQLIPELKKRVVALDTAQAEVNNMKRIAHDLVRIQYDSYNWDEEVLVKTAAKNNLKLNLISPAQYKSKIDKEDHLLQRQHVSIKNERICLGRHWQPDAIQMSFGFELSDYLDHADLYRSMVRSKTPQYGPFITGLVASKMILVLLNDPLLRRRLLGSKHGLLKDTILPAFPLQNNAELIAANYDEFVLKHTDGLGGEQVFIGKDLYKKLKKIPPKHHTQWIVQERTRLNMIKVHGILSRPRKVISDLGVFVHYDWAQGDFKNFQVGGFITRATNRSFKVNVSGGGIQVPVMFAK